MFFTLFGTHFSFLLRILLLHSLSLSCLCIVWLLLIFYPPHVLLPLCFISHFSCCMFLFSLFFLSSYLFNSHPHLLQHRLDFLLSPLVAYDFLSSPKLPPTCLPLLHQTNSYIIQHGNGGVHKTLWVNRSPVSANRTTALSLMPGSGWAEGLFVKLYWGLVDCACRRASLRHHLHLNHAGKRTHAHTCTHKQAACT